MGWTAPRTWVDGEVVTASIMNTHVRDNFEDIRDAKTCQAYRNTTQSITNTASVVEFVGGANWDPLNWHSLTSNPGRITPDIAGKFHVHANIEFASNNSGTRYLTLLKNSTIVARERVPAIDGYPTTVSISAIVELNGTSDYVSIFATVTGPASLNILGTNSSAACEFTATWLGA